MNNTKIKFKMEDLTTLKIRNVEDLAHAQTQIKAQINKWLGSDDTSIHNLSSILLNKLVYYISKEVNKINKDFIIDSGWYIYGPCYEEGRQYELYERPMTFQPVADDISNEVKIVCDDLIPKFNSWNRKGKALTEFLRYIYTDKNKCDQPKFKDFYIAKHEMLCILYDFYNWGHQDLTIVNDSDICKKQRAYEKIFYEDKYKKLVHLTSEEMEEIRTFLGMMNRYLNFVVEEQNSSPLITTIFDIHKKSVLTGLCHLNYAETFQSFSKTHTNNKKNTEIQKGHRLLSRLKEENRSLSREMFDLICKGTT